MWLFKAFNDAAVLREASIEDVAFLVLEQARRTLHNGQFSPHNLAISIRDAYGSLGPVSQVAQPSLGELEDMKRVVLEALAWLESEGLIAHDYSSNGWYIITRIGEEVRSREDLSSYSKRAYLPREVLHEQLSEVALSPFLAGRYDEAVRAAFTRLEVAIREAAGYGHDRYGVPMVRDAFNPGKKDTLGSEGPLTDPELEFTEREGVGHLFAGAMGYIKNPLSHRELNIDDARLAASRILLANDLMYTLRAHLEKKRQREQREATGGGF